MEPSEGAAGVVAGEAGFGVSLPPWLKKKDGVTYVQTPQSRSAYAVVASNYHNNPSSKLSLIGVTGTNGKTSIVQLLFEVFQHLGFSVGKLSTIENAINEHIYPATHTTPDPMEINSFLAKTNIHSFMHFCIFYWINYLCANS